jgi:RNA polymerase sigma-70 factor (ECF subfamily)
MDFLRKECNSKLTAKHIDINNIDITDKSNNLERDMILSEKTRLMYKCINNLNFIDKTIISLYLEELSYREISDIVGITEKNVSVKIARLKRKLNKCLKDY